MKNKTYLANGRFISFAAAALSLVCASAVQAGLQIPYTPNADTLHLWHLNDAAGQLYAADQGVIPMTLTNLGLPGPADGLVIPYPAGGYTNCGYGALFGANCTDATLNSLLGSCFVASNKSTTAPSAFGTCLIGAIGDNINNYQNATTGAFTMEMLLNINASLANTYFLINGDSGLSVRGWQWRINGGATPGLEFNGVNTPNTDFKANLPTTGPDAIATNTWYHVAITYTGTAPTNSDTAGVVTMYWTLVDPSRTNADILATFSTANFLGATVTPTFCIGTDARGVKASNPQVYGGGSTLSQANCPGTGKAFDFESNMGEAPGYMAEVRITDLCLQPNQMAFTAGGPTAACILNPTSPQNLLVGYGQTLIEPALVSGSPTPVCQWYQNGTNSANAVAGQTNATLSIGDATFANGGIYYLIASNSLGKVTSPAVTVTIGAVASELYATGFDTNGLIMASPANNPDPHYTLIQSADPFSIGPDVLVFDTNQCPIVGASGCVGGTYTPNDGISTWIGPKGNSGGSSISDPSGRYVYRTQFVLDQVIPSTVMLTIGGSSAGEVTNIFINGTSVGPLPIAPVPGYVLYFWNAVTIANSGAFVAGLNTMDLMLDTTVGFGEPGGQASIRVEPSIIGQANLNGTPVILQQPANQTVRDATLSSTSSQASFSVVAQSRPPISYQWYADGNPISGATGRTLTYVNPTAPQPGTNFSVVVTGPSGSTNSSTAVLTLISSNQPPIAPNYTYYVYTNASALTNDTLNIDTSLLLANASDPIAGIPVPGAHGDATPDGNSLSITYDAITTNGVTLSVRNTILTYDPSLATGSAVPDTFNYYISDAYGEMATGVITIYVAGGLPQASAVAAGGSVAMSGSGGVPNGSYIVLEATNITIPVGLWKTNASGTFDEYGNYLINLPINSATNPSYYLLKWSGASSAVQVPPFANGR